MKRSDEGVREVHGIAGRIAAAFIESKLTPLLVIANLSPSCAALKYLALTLTPTSDSATA